MAATFEKYSKLIRSEGIRCGAQTLKLATTEEERRAVYKLRYKIFNQELGEGIKENEVTGLDQDIYDKYCDHLMILQGQEQRVVGTYRLLHGPKRPPQGFYSEEEFNIDKLHIDPSMSVELGRGCIDPEYRRQATLMNLLFGLTVYLDCTGSRYLFGCGSLPQQMNANDAKASYKILDDRGDIVHGKVFPKDSHSFDGNASLGQPSVPPLVEVYIKFGAKIFGEPAYDSIFGCYDVFILIDREKVNEWGLQMIERFDKRLQGRGAEL